MSDQIILFANFCLNYPPNFIKRVWGDNNISNHLEGKFSIAYDRSTSRGAMIDFYSMLDKENREILSEWVLENHKG